MPESPEPVALDGSHLGVAGLEAVARRGARVSLAAGVRERLAAGRAVVEGVLAAGESVYGLTTGVAERKRVRIDPARQAELNRRLVATHRVAQGPDAPEDVVRATLVVLANGLAKGAAGVRPGLVEAILELTADRSAPPSVRRLGSVGQADLGPMADLAHGLVARTGVELAAGEGLALLDNNAFSTAWSALALADAGRLLATMDVAAALDFEAFRANLGVLHPVVAETRPFAGVVATVARLRELLAGSALWQAGAARNLQDPLSFRCVPQVHGAARHALGYATATIETEMNSAQGNPLVALDEARIVSVGNFDAGITAAAVDFARLALAPVLAAAAERTVKLLQAPWSGLAPGLAADPASGDDGLAELAVAAQALAVEARTLALPVSHELVSTTKGEGIEDRTSMAPLSARRLAEMLGLAARLVAVELVVAAQAVDLACPPTMGDGPHAAHAALRELVATTTSTASFPVDLEAVVALVASGRLAGDAPGRDLVTNEPAGG